MSDSSFAANFSPSMELPLFPLHLTNSHPSFKNQLVSLKFNYSFWPLWLAVILAAKSGVILALIYWYRISALLLLLNFLVNEVLFAYKLASSNLGTLLSTSCTEPNTMHIQCLKLWVKCEKEWLNGWLADSEGMNLTGCPEVNKAHKLCQGGWGKHIFPKGVKKHGTGDYFYSM